MSNHFVIYSREHLGIIIVMDPETGGEALRYPENADKGEQFRHSNAVLRYLQKIAGGPQNYTPHHIVGTAPAPAGIDHRGWITFVRKGED